MPETLHGLIQMMVAAGVKRLYAKRMAANDNSKNQVYLGGDFSALNILPHGRVSTDENGTPGSKRDRAKAKINLWWLDQDGKLFLAPSAQLILYPKYPEVRLSGFLSGCEKAPSEIMRVRDEGRFLFLGVCENNQIIGYATKPDSPISNEIATLTELEDSGVFLQIPLRSTEANSRTKLLQALANIYRMRWVSSRKLDKYGVAQPYSAPNGGGYTLEALLGISPNGYSEPDFLGWEIKQYGVRNFEKFRPKSPVTLMTPEPTAGEYQDLGIGHFLRTYGYPDQSGKADRLNFGGKYVFEADAHHLTGLRLQLEGFDRQTCKISDMDGGLVLLSKTGDVAAKWKFANMLEHWNRKHSKAAYVPSLFQTPPPEYSFGAKVLLCEQTDFSLFLSAIITGSVFYDPGIKMENVSTDKPKIKKRSQFRVSHKDLPALYRSSSYFDL